MIVLHSHTEYLSALKLQKQLVSRWRNNIISDCDLDELNNITTRIITYERSLIKSK